MGFFNRRPRDDAVNGHANGHSNGHHTNGHSAGHKGGILHGRRGHGAEPYTMSRRPSFGQWLKGTLLDIITMICMGALGLGVSSHPIPPSDL